MIVDIIDNTPLGNNVPAKILAVRLTTVPADVSVPANAW
jgi:hypothetical protein